MTRFQTIISNALKESLSDIYITGGHPMVSRKHGSIQFHGVTKWSPQEIDDLVRSLLTARQLDMLRQRKSVDYAMSVSNARLRINFFTTARGISLAIRILTGHIPTIDELNLHPSLKEIAKLEAGLVLTCGSTGVGKTTTIAAIINDINRSRQVHVITLENPIEYRFKSDKAFIQQRELGAHMPSFAQGLLDVLRENPDVIFVGELREPETMQLTLNAAESGHLVIATMHASTPEEAIYRLCNAVPPESQNEVRYQLASTLIWLIVQQLVYVEKIGYLIPALTIVRGTSAVKNIIRENKLNQLNNAIQLGKNDGMFTTERYWSEYLATRKNLIPYAQILHASPEAVQEEPYESPLTEEIYDAPPLKKRAVASETEPIVVQSRYNQNEMENMLTIDEGESLSELLKSLDKKRS
jgi:twitching motility protein PilT